MWRTFHFHVEGLARDGDRLFVAGLVKVEPLQLGDLFRWHQPGSAETSPEVRCALRIESILWGGAYVTWINAITPVELELSGEGTLVAIGAELRGESEQELAPFDKLGRGTPRVV
jgi:hypothetical protein